MVGGGGGPDGPAGASLQAAAIPQAMTVPSTLRDGRVLMTYLRSKLTLPVLQPAMNVSPCGVRR
jgi:hypothetical protein